MDFKTLADRWTGSRAATFHADKYRWHPEKWKNEHRVIEEMLQQTGTDGRILDVPIGTGRLLEVHQRSGKQLTGVDASQDMLEQAKARAEAIGYPAVFQRGDIRNLPFPDNHFDVVVCMSFLGWVDRHSFPAVMQELARVARRYVIAGGLRHYLPAHELQLSSVRGMLELGRQLRWSVRQALRPEPKPRIHKAARITSDFQRTGLRIVQSVRVQRRRKDASESVVYWLAKENTPLAQPDQPAPVA